MSLWEHAFRAAVGTVIAASVMGACASPASRVAGTQSTGTGSGVDDDRDGSDAASSSSDAASAKDGAHKSSDASNPFAPGASNADASTAPSQSGGLCTSRSYTFDVQVTGSSASWNGLYEPKLSAYTSEDIFGGLDGPEAFIWAAVQSSMQATLDIASTGDATFHFTSPTVAPAVLSKLEADTSAWLKDTSANIIALSVPMTPAIHAALASSSVNVPAIMMGSQYVTAHASRAQWLMATCIPEVVEIDNGGPGGGPL